MKRIKHILLASVLLLVGLFSATGCDEKEIKLDFLNDVTEITYSIYPSDDMRTHVTDKEDIALLSSFFSDSEYKKITEEDLNEDISKNIIIEITSEENLYNISVYPDGKVSAIIKGVGYISTSAAANYNGLLNKTQELRVEYEHYENTYFLRDAEEIWFLLSGYESVHTYVTDKEDLDKILSVLSAASYRERLYNEESGTIFNCMSLIIFGENWTAEMTVYPENLVDVCVSSDEDGSLTYYISDENVNFEEFKALLTEMREKYGIGPHK